LRFIFIGLSAAPNVPYCDFNSHVSNDVDSKIFGDALCTEMTYMASLMPSRPAPFKPVFWRRHAIINAAFIG
jgi:hypothetical protein